MPGKLFQCPLFTGLVDIVDTVNQDDSPVMSKVKPHDRMVNTDVNGPARDKGIVLDRVRNEFPQYLIQLCLVKGIVTKLPNNNSSLLWLKLIDDFRRPSSNF